MDRERDLERLPLRLRRELARLPERLRLRLRDPLFDLDRERDLERLPLRRELARLPERLRLLDPLLDLDLDLDLERLPLRLRRELARLPERLRLRLREPLFERERDLDRLRDLDLDLEPDLAFEGDLDLEPDFAFDGDLDLDLAFDGDLDLEPDMAFDGDLEPDRDRLFLDLFDPTLRLRLFLEFGVPLRDLVPFFTGLSDSSRDSTLSLCAALLFCWSSPPVVSAAAADGLRDRDRFELTALPALPDRDRDLAGLELRDRDFLLSSAGTGVASRETD